MGIIMMKKARTLGALFLVGIVGITSAAETARAQTQTNAQGDTFVMQWTEDFTKQESLNTSRWNLCKRPVPTFDSTYGMKLEGVSWVSASPYPNGSPNASYDGSTKFGRYTARIFNDPATTQNQAFWLVRPVLTNDDWNEIDIETYNAGWLKGGTIIPVYTLHFGDWTPAVGSPPQRDTTVVHPRGWHDWMIDWTPNYISFYCDGDLRAIFHNSAWKPGWTELNGTGVEAQLFPQSISFTNADKGGIGKDDSAGLMAVSSASYWALDMQRFTAPGYSSHSGGTVGIDSKYRQIPPKERLEEHQYVNDLGPGDYLQYNGVQTKWRNIAIQVDCDTPGRQIEIRTGSPTGPIIGTINVPVTRGPQHIYNDLVIKNDPTRIFSKKRPFDTGNANSDNRVGNTLNITGGAGFTPGAYKVIAVAEDKDPNKGEATLDRPVGEANATGGQGTLQYVNPIRYTLASADLDARTGAPQDIFLTFAGGKGGVSLYNLYFFGAEPTSKLGDVSGEKTKVFAPEEMLDH